ncbi:hypothetical protein D3C76_1429470 [compost metagenome]
MQVGVIDDHALQLGAVPLRQPQGGTRLSGQNMQDRTVEVAAPPGHATRFVTQLIEGLIARSVFNKVFFFRRILVADAF